MKFSGSLALVGGALIVTATLCATHGSAADNPKVCVVLDKMNVAREGEIKLWRNEAAKFGLTLIEEVAGEDAQRQSAQIDTCIARGVAGVVDIPWDYQAVLQDIERAHAAKIPFVTMDQAPADTSTVDFHISADPYADGQQAAKRLIAIMGDKPAKVVDLQGALSAYNGQKRDQGFKDGIAGHANIKIVAEVPTEWHPEPVLAGVENAFQSNPDLNVIYAATDGFLPPIWSALKKAGRYAKIGEAGHVVVLSIDGDPQGCQAAKDGYLDAGYAAPFGEMTQKTLEAVINFSKGGKKLADIDRIKVIPSTEYTSQTIAKIQGDIWGCVR
jgi:ABC-type sugar transport system substrate-binding protein